MAATETEAVVVTVRDGQLYLNVIDPELREAITDATSYKPVGVEYRLRGQRRDQRVKLVYNNRGPVGLLDRVCRVIQEHGHELEVHWADSWVAPKRSVHLRLTDTVLFDYQQEAVLAAILNERGIIRAPTGSGKTLIGAGIIQAKRYPALVIVPTIDLLYQYKDQLANRLVPEPGHTYPSSVSWRIGQLGDGVVDPQPITVSTIRTIAKVVGVAYETYEFGEYDDKDDTPVNARALREWVNQIGTLIVDESHILGAKVVYEVATKIPALAKYGMSASPWRDDGADLRIEAATGPLICRIGVQRLVDAGRLMAPRFVVLSTKGWWQPAAWGQVCANCGKQALRRQARCSCGSQTFRSQFNEAYKQEIVENPVRNRMIAQLVAELGCRTLVLVKRVKHGQLLQHEIPDSVFLSGRDKGEDRKAAFDSIRRGDLRVLICTTIADMGLDIPALEALVLAGGGKSSTRHLQRVGRVVRTNPGKRQPIVIDLNDGHVYTWFARHAAERRKIEYAEWGSTATWHSTLK